MNISNELKAWMQRIDGIRDNVITDCEGQVVQAQPCFTPGLNKPLLIEVETLLRECVGMDYRFDELRTFRPERIVELIRAAMRQAV